MANIRQKKGVWFFDPQGVLLASHEGHLDMSFDTLLELLLRRHQTVWVEGIPVNDEGRLPHHSFHMPKGKVLDKVPSLRGSVAIRFVKGVSGRTLDMDYFSLEDCEKILAEKAASRTSAPLETFTGDMANFDLEDNSFLLMRAHRGRANLRYIGILGKLQFSPLDKSTFTC